MKKNEGIEYESKYHLKTNRLLWKKFKVLITVKMAILC